AFAHVARSTSSMSAGLASAPMRRAPSTTTAAAPMAIVVSTAAELTIEASDVREGPGAEHSLPGRVRLASPSGAFSVGTPSTATLSTRTVSITGDGTEVGCSSNSSNAPKPLAAAAGSRVPPREVPEASAVTSTGASGVALTRIAGLLPYVRGDASELIELGLLSPRGFPGHGLEQVRVQRLDGFAVTPPLEQRRARLVSAPEGGLQPLRGIALGGFQARDHGTEPGGVDGAGFLIEVVLQPRVASIPRGGERALGQPHLV